MPDREHTTAAVRSHTSPGRLEADPREKALRDPAVVVPGRDLLAGR